MARIARLRPGVALRVATNGTLGVLSAREQTPDLVLLDLHLPDIQGDEVLERLRAEPSLAGVPVVVVTADATPGLEVPPGPARRGRRHHQAGRRRRGARLDRPRGGPLTADFAGRHALRP